MKRIFLHLLLFWACFLFCPAPSFAQEEQKIPDKPSRTIPPGPAPQGTTGKEKDVKKDNLKDIPYEYFEEHDDFIKYCMADRVLTQYYNCDCLAYEFLNKRIELGPRVPRNNIMLKISRTCMDAAGAAGYEYQECLGNAPILPPNIKPTDFCKCLASTYAKMFEDYSVMPTSKSFVELKSRAYIMCSDPKLGKKLYPYTPPPKKK